MNEAASKPVHTVSVRELIEFVLRRGDLGGERQFVGSDRAMAGIRGHQKIQRSRPAGYDRIKPALREVLGLPEINRSALEAVAQKHQVCPFELSLDASIWAEVVICDYNHVFDPQVYLRRFFSRIQTQFKARTESRGDVVAGERTSVQGP